MSTAVSAAGVRPGWPALAGWVLALAAVGFAAWVYWGLGPRAKGRDWWEPKASVARTLSETSLAPLVEELPVALGGFGLAALALAAAVFATTRSAVARFLAVFGVLATLCFVFYSVEARFVWSFFRWRWSASLALFSAVVAAAATAPLLAASWLRQRWPLRVALYLPILLGLLAYERNVTGTDPALRFAISPWPVIQIFGLELVAACLGAAVMGVGIGLGAVARARRGGGAALWIVGAVAAATLVHQIGRGGAGRQGGGRSNRRLGVITKRLLQHLVGDRLGGIDQARQRGDAGVGGLQDLHAVADAVEQVADVAGAGVRGRRR